MLKIFNKIFNEGSWPITWKNGTIIPIPKQEKKFKSEGYRSITLLNIICKILEKIINHRLTWLVEKYKFLSKQQSGKAYDSTWRHNMLILNSIKFYPRAKHSIS